MDRIAATSTLASSEVLSKLVHSVNVKPWFSAQKQNLKKCPPSNFATASKQAWSVGDGSGISDGSICLHLQLC